MARSCTKRSISQIPSRRRLGGPNGYSGWSEATSSRIEDVAENTIMPEVMSVWFALPHKLTARHERERMVHVSRRLCSE